MEFKNQFKTYLRVLIAAIFCLCLHTAGHAADKYVVVIDPGHGGKDYGAIDNGIREKDINLKVALKVGEHIKKQNKNIKVVYTRDKDEYITLQQRADKANKAKGDLFISIHTNSVDAKNPNRTSVEGASTYTLGLHKGDNNMNVARRENSVMTLEPNFETKYSGFDPRSDESYIIFEMAQKANMAQSVKFAEQVQKQMTKQAGRKDRGVHQAGFWVLWATSMPSVLIELDFICNPKSANYMKSESGQNQMARAIATATDSYFKNLSQHKKNRLHTQNDNDTEMEDSSDKGFANAQEGVVLASAPDEEKKGAAPTEWQGMRPAERTRKPANRRRRSDASREKSERRQYAVAVIQEENVYVDNSAMKSLAQTEMKTEASPSTTTVADPKKTKGKKNNKAKKEIKTPVNKKTDKKAGRDLALNTPKKQVSQKSTKPAKIQKPSGRLADNKTTRTDNRAETSNEEKSPVRLSKITTVYKIQLLSSNERLKAGSPLFQGLDPVTCIAEGNEYKYVYGESTNRNEIYRMLADVQKRIPDAQVIKVRKAVQKQN